MTGHEIVGGRLRSYGNDGYGADCTCGHVGPLCLTKERAAAEWLGHAVERAYAEYKAAAGAEDRR